MKALNYISVLALLALMSCTSSLYTGAEYDDLYFLPSDQPVAAARKSAKKQITEGNLKSEDYYNNIYAADTLVSDEFSDAVDYDEAYAYQNVNNYNNNNYYDNFSYSGRLRNFYGGSFYPYWRDPFYYSWGYPSFYFGYGGYNPFSYNPYYYDPYFYDYGYYGGYYGGNYGYNPYYSYYSPYYSPFYGGWNNYSYRDGESSIPYVRRDRQSNLSSRWNTPSPVSASSRRDGFSPNGTVSATTKRSAAETSPIGIDARRAAATSASSRVPAYTNQSKAEQVTTRNADTRINNSTQRSTVVSRPTYNNVNRTYTPSYNNPRMPTRPSYNNSRVNNEVSSGRPSTNSGTPENASRSNSYSAPVQTRTAPSYNNSRSYSAPARSNVENNSGNSRSYQSPSNNSGGNYRSSQSSPSYSNGSGGSNYSSGSSSGSSSSSRDVSSGSSSSGRR